MAHFRRLAEGIDPTEVLAQLAAQPELWDRNPERTRLVPNSPHRETSDIWVRFRDPAELHEPADYGEPHFAVFYPAWHALPALRPIVFAIMALVKAVYLGGILITRIPSGKCVYPHVDTGWHPEYLNRKVYVVLQANDSCINWCDDERVIMRAGDAWAFNNLVEHGVINQGDHDRISLIITMRADG